MFINLSYKRTFGIFINNIMENFAYQEHKIDIFTRNIKIKIKNTPHHARSHLLSYNQALQIISYNDGLH